jgi:hypothetical protein
MLKNVTDETQVAIKDLFNRCLREDKFPEE